MARLSTIDSPKILLSPLDTSKATFSGIGINPGTLVNSGVNFFGGTLSLGVAKAAVNIGPPVTIPGLALPFSLWVDGISVFVGATFFMGSRISLAFVQNQVLFFQKILYLKVEADNEAGKGAFHFAQ